MTITELIDEYNLSDDDIRWSLSMRIAESLAILLNEEGVPAVARKLWSGEIGDELYDIVERWIRVRGENLERTILDEGHMRDELSQMSVDAINRRQN